LLNGARELRHSFAALRSVISVAIRGRINLAAPVTQSRNGQRYRETAAILADVGPFMSITTRIFRARAVNTSKPGSTASPQQSAPDTAHYFSRVMNSTGVNFPMTSSAR